MAGRERPTDEKLKQNLEFLALAVSSHVNNAFSAAVLQFAALGYFMHNGQEMFTTNPANTLPHTALEALEDQSVLEFYERYKVTRHYSPVRFRCKEIELLRQHRDVIGHPATIEWGSKEKDRFANENRHNHFRCGLLWTIAKKFDKALVDQGSAPRLATMPATYQMGEMLNLILRLSMKPQYAPLIPAAAHLQTYLEGQLAGITNVLERFPNGTQPSHVGDDLEAYEDEDDWASEG